MGEETLASVKELLLARIEAIDKVTHERVQGTNRALDLQTAEVSRRLDLLNGEAERLRIIQATYVPREVSDAVTARLETSMKGLTEKIDSLVEFRANIMGKQAVLTGLIALVVSALVVLISRLF